ncbi:hypothetical protein ACFWNK_38185 [Streptomyces sp. NPDC058417]|uniref:hypothetical protein n=1 Tax=unclassified Streptomyces TaxID=2593676 RepID=UPI0036585E6F
MRPPLSRRLRRLMLLRARRTLRRALLSRPDHPRLQQAGFPGPPALTAAPHPVPARPRTDATGRHPAGHPAVTRLPDVLQAIYADMVMRAAGLIPQEPYHSHDRPWPATCTGCGETVNPRFRQIRSGSGGCRSCAQLTRHARTRTAPQEHPSAGRPPGLPPPGDTAARG